MLAAPPTYPLLYIKWSTIIESDAVLRSRVTVHAIVIELVSSSSSTASGSVSITDYCSDADHSSAGAWVSAVAVACWPLVYCTVIEKMMVRIVVTQHTLSPDLWLLQAEWDYAVWGKRVDAMSATCQQSCEQRDHWARQRICFFQCKGSCLS